LAFAFSAALAWLQACAKMRDDPSQCKFFEFADDTQAAGGSTAKGGSTTKGGGSAGAWPNCSCGVRAALLKVNKDGPNKGRSFYSCSKPRYSPSCASIHPGLRAVTTAMRR
jgi:hypothetical protein